MDPRRRSPADRAARGDAPAPPRRRRRPCRRAGSWMVPTGPGTAERPTRDSRVVAELVGFGRSSLDGEVLEQALALATAPLPCDPADPNHAALPSESQGLDTPLNER